MLTGLPPFYSRVRSHMQDKILKMDVRCPPSFGGWTVSLVESLLLRDPSRRLGSGVGDVKELEMHAFFRPLDFDKVYAKQYPPLYTPKLDNDADDAKVDPKCTRERSGPTTLPHGSGPLVKPLDDE